MELDVGDPVIVSMGEKDEPGEIVGYCSDSEMCCLVRLGHPPEVLHVLIGWMRFAPMPLTILCEPEDVLIVRNGNRWTAYCHRHGNIGSFEHKDDCGLGLFPRESQQPIRDHFPDTRIAFYTDWSRGICRVLAQEAATWA